ncbi:MAG TPA: hypothetical protein PLI74_03500 [Candidatus Kapabacteria bacterium]|jgi:hypothetical protein|nr:hypothetical protein [Ignavibacteria bacterium]HRI29967.1 hypothetical protein [Candidatus Kapabacteria bacterium]HRK58683.1 hypothetical protein [Candidatus Kapabacteria bacterium]
MKTSFSVGAILAAIISLVIVVFLLSSHWKSSKIAKNVTFEGLYVLTADQILQEISLSKADALKMGSENLAALQDTLYSNYYIASAEAVFSDISTITVTIREKVPEYLLVNDNNRLFYVNRHRELLDYTRFAAYYDLPLVRGILQDSLVDSVAFSDIMAVTDALSASSTEKNFVEDISEIIYNKGTISLLLSNSPCRIIVGKWKENRKDAIGHSIAEAIQFSEKKHLVNKTIDLRWEQMVVVK